MWCQAGARERERKAKLEERENQLRLEKMREEERLKAEADAKVPYCVPFIAVMFILSVLCAFVSVHCRPLTLIQTTALVPNYLR